MNTKIVTLLRRFEPSRSGLGRWSSLGRSSNQKSLRWHDIVSGFRNLVLADPGAGKTFEARAQASRLRERGKQAFFIRLEFLKADFEQAFEVGNAEDFEHWLRSGDEGWFFLDSVDEAQLDAPNALEDALRIFGRRIHDARERAHVCITSRDDAWEALPDRRLVNEYLPHSSIALSDEGSGKHRPDDGMQVYRMMGLNIDEIRMFAVHQGVTDEHRFVAELEKHMLMGLAQNPFDLISLARVWVVDGALGSRLDVLNRMVDLQLDPSRGPSLIKIDVPRRRHAIAMLAGAVTLTGKTKLRCPDGDLAEDRIDCAQVIQHVSAEELANLLGLGVFDDEVYGAVRFRHREVRELLTAQWLATLLTSDEGRAFVEDLCIRERYGEQVLVPRLRPILPWLIVFDEAIRDRVLAIDPAIAPAGGDPTKLPLDIRRSVLRAIVQKIENGAE